MFNGKEEKKQYANETMVVIDDPVSSFDIDNRIGIISFLNRQFRMLLTGNENTRVVLMSHDLQTIDDINKVFKAIYSSNSWKKNNKKDFLMLENNKLEPNEKILNEYQSLIDIVYDYANGNPNGNELTIGNTTRRVAEAFTTFEYKGGIDELLNSEVLGTIHDDTLRNYFEGRLTNILLHGSSHMQDRIKTLTNPGFTAQFSEQDKQNTARISSAFCTCSTSRICPPIWTKNLISKLLLNSGARTYGTKWEKKQRRINNNTCMQFKYHCAQSTFYNSLKFTQTKH